MRCALHFTVAFLGLVMTVNSVMAQTSYNYPPMSKNGLAQRNGRRLPPVTPNRSQQTPANMAHQPIGSGVPANSRAGLTLGQSLGGSIGRAALTANQYPGLQSQTRGYSTPQYSTPQYSTPQYSTQQYSTQQYSTQQYSTQQSPAPGYPAYRIPAPGYAAPGYRAPGYRGPGNTAPAYSMPRSQPPRYPAARNRVNEYPVSSPMLRP
jgi:hypothetical protein